MSDDIVARLRALASEFPTLDGIMDSEWTNAADEIERLRNELAARCGDHGPGAHTAGPVEHFIPEAL